MSKPRTRKRGRSKAHPMLFSEAEIEAMLVGGLVNFWLSERHSDLLKSLTKEARVLLAPLDERKLRWVASERLGDPTKEITDLVKEVQSPEWEQEERLRQLWKVQEVGDGSSNPT